MFIVKMRSIRENNVNYLTFPLPRINVCYIFAYILSFIHVHNYTHVYIYIS